MFQLKKNQKKRKKTKANLRQLGQKKIFFNFFIFSETSTTKKLKRK